MVWLNTFYLLLFFILSLTTEAHLSLFEDYVPELMEQRSKYREVLSELYNLGLKPALLFPARLTIVTKDGKRRRFASVTEAKDYIASIRPAEV